MTFFSYFLILANLTLSSLRPPYILWSPRAGTFAIITQEGRWLLMPFGNDAAPHAASPSSILSKYQSSLGPQRSSLKAINLPLWGQASRFQSWANLRWEIFQYNHISTRGYSVSNHLSSTLTLTGLKKQQTKATKRSRWEIEDFIKTGICRRVFWLLSQPMGPKVLSDKQQWKAAEWRG